MTKSKSKLGAGLVALDFALLRSGRTETESTASDEVYESPMVRFSPSIRIANTGIATGNEGLLAGKRCAGEPTPVYDLGFPDVHLPLRCLAAGEVAIWSGAWKCRWAIVSMRLGYLSNAITGDDAVHRAVPSQHCIRQRDKSFVYRPLRPRSTSTIS